MHQSIIRSAATAGEPITLKMYDNTTIRGHVTACDEDGLVVIDARRVINLAQVREVHISDAAMTRVIGDATPLI